MWKNNRLSTFTRKVMGFESWKLLDLEKFWPHEKNSTSKCFKKFKKCLESWKKYICEIFIKIWAWIKFFESFFLLGRLHTIPLFRMDLRIFTLNPRYFGIETQGHWFSGITTVNASESGQIYEFSKTNFFLRFWWQFYRTSFFVI